MGFPRQEYWSGLPFLSPENLPNPGIEPMSPALAGRFFITELRGRKQINLSNNFRNNLGVPSHGYFFLHQFLSLHVSTIFWPWFSHHLMLSWL